MLSHRPPRPPGPPALAVLTVTILVGLAACLPVPAAAKSEKPRPDLTVSNLSLAPSQGPPGTKVTVTLTVRNAGPIKASASSVAFHLGSTPDDPLSGATALGTIAVQSLRAGGSTRLAATLTIPAVQAGTYSVVALADLNDLIDESIEANNSATTPFAVLPEELPSQQDEVYPPPDGPKGPQYYVAPNGNDANDGSVDGPWRTIQHAALAVGPGATVNVAPGDYAGPVLTERSGTPQARIRFLSSERWGARIYYAGTDYWQVWLNRGDYVDIVGFDVSGGGDVRNGIQNDASFVRIMNNHVHNIPNKGCGDSNGGAGIVNGNESASESEILANVVHEIGNISDPCNIIHGIYHSHLRGRIANNITYRNQGSGIHTWHSATKVTIVNNLTFANGVAGIVVGAAPDSGVVADHFEVRYNIIVYNGYGMYESGSTGPSNRYYNNLVYGNLVWNLSLDNPDYNTIIQDPGFIDYQPDGSGDYRLSPSSVAIDAGSSVSAPKTDITGLSRPYGASWDIGPYEWRP